MEMRAKFSWIFLLLGFSLIAITFEGVQGGDETDGPTEVDCMPYIEKALKEKAGGEAQKDPSDKNESAEDYPTVEITDDTSAQESDDERDHDDSRPSEHSTTIDDAAASVENFEDETQLKDDATQRTEESKKSQEDEKSEEVEVSKEIHDETTEQVSQEDEKAGSIEDDKESIEEKLEVRKEAVKIVQPQTKSVEKSIEQEDDESLEATKNIESIEDTQSVEDLKDESKDISKERTKEVSKESKESKEENASKEVTGCPPSDEVNCKDGSTRCNKHRHCGEGKICCLNKCYQRKCIPGTPTSQELAEEGSEESAEETQESKSSEKVPSEPQTGCPNRDQVACKEGPTCGKHKQCGEGKICCPNKCYHRKCIEGTPTEKDLLDEESEEESEEEEEKSAEKKPLAPRSGCPGSNQVPCKDGESCTKHRHCSGGKICCTNKCYRKRCVSGEATSEELAAEEESEEEVQEEKKTTEKTPVSSTGCPDSAGLACGKGAACTKHRHCNDGEICCVNKCYRRACVPGTPTEADLAVEGSDESEEQGEEKAERAEEREGSSTEGTGCPDSTGLACGKGSACTKHRHCEDGEICCVNKCYRRTCVPGTPTEGDLAAESSEESEEQVDEQAERPEKRSSGPKSGCPTAGEVSCTEGDVCSKHKHCGSGKICCANKCYRKRCVSGEATEEELAAEEGEDSEEDKEESEEVVVSGEAGGCPSPDKVPCKGGERCTEDEECDLGEICCTNKCYNKRCVPGTPSDKDKLKAVSKESKKEEESIEEQAESLEEIEEAAASVETEEAVSEEVPARAPSPPVKVVTIVAKPSLKEKSTPPVQESKPKVEVRVPEPKKQAKPAPTKVEVNIPEPKRDVRKPERVARSIEESSIETGGVDAVEELSLDYEIPSNLRTRTHVEQLLKLESTTPEKDTVQYQVYEETLKELKKLYEQAIKPLETLYKYRDLSNRHFGDAEIFSKPLVLFMGPWSGGKSSIINYLVNNEYNTTSLRTGAEPSPAYFNILMYGDEPQIVDGTELAADFTFSGLQKFGQGLEERLRGVKLPSKLLEKVNIVEIPGILEVRKQVSRVFPFNDACQWFIDRADIIFLVYDPAKLDVGPETEAILDQLKGREHQTRIVLNKADQVRPEELMRVQGALIWNISPLMSSPHPPVMYTTSLWSRPYEPGAPMRLLQAQERAFLRDLRTAVDNRVEHKISSARRFAVRVRNHAKMVDCYLTTYYNHKSVFGNKNKVANEIIDHPQNYHIYEGLSTLTNISRYDLPDPEAYRDFFRLNPLYEFQPLSATCTYFRGCPINRLDIAIAYDFPELLGTYKRNLEKALNEAASPSQENTPAQKKTNKKSKS